MQQLVADALRGFSMADTWSSPEISDTLTQCATFRVFNPLHAA
eukprot:COSAG01_NODE_29099_length_645_cov_1.227106_1_plen_42_part_10